MRSVQTRWKRTVSFSSRHIIRKRVLRINYALLEREQLPLIRNYTVMPSRSRWKWQIRWIRNRSFPPYYSNFRSKRERRVPSSDACTLHSCRAYIVLVLPNTCDRIHPQTFPHTRPMPMKLVYTEKSVVIAATRNLIASTRLKIKLHLLERRLMELDVNYSFLRVLFRNERSLNGSSYTAINR